VPGVPIFPQRRIVSETLAQDRQPNRLRSGRRKVPAGGEKRQGHDMASQSGSVPPQVPKIKHGNSAVGKGHESAGAVVRQAGP
jgi:hypothetical protein